MAPSENSGMEPSWKTSNSWMQEITTGMIERGIDDLGVGRQGGVEKEKKTLGTERSENIKNLYIYVNKKYYYINLFVRWGSFSDPRFQSTGTTTIEMVQY